MISSTGYFDVISEYEVNRKYTDLLIIPKDKTKGYHSILIEFKYLKKEQAELLEETKKEAKEQITEYSKLERIKEIPNLVKYTIVAVNDELYVDKV